MIKVDYLLGNLCARSLQFENSLICFDQWTLDTMMYGYADNGIVTYSDALHPCMIVGT